MGRCKRIMGGILNLLYESGTLNFDYFNSPGFCFRFNKSILKKRVISIRLNKFIITKKYCLHKNNFNEPK